MEEDAAIAYWDRSIIKRRGRIKKREIDDFIE